MKIIKTPIFKRYEKKLTPNELNQLKKAEKLLLQNPNHPSLNLKKIICQKEKSRFSIRINKNYRVLFDKQNDNYYFHCICNHNEYDKINKNC